MKPRLEHSIAGVAGAVLALAAALAISVGVAQATSPRPWEPGQPNGAYDWTESAAIIVLGKVAAADNAGLHVDVQQVLQGAVPSKRMVVTPSLVSGCVGNSPVLRVGERAVFFTKQAQNGTFPFVVPGSVLNLRFAGQDTVPAVCRLMEITRLSDKGQRARIIINLLESTNKILRRAAHDYVFAHIIAPRDVEPYVAQMISTLSSRDAEARQIAAQALEHSRNRAVIAPLVKATHDPDIRVVAAASAALGRFNTPESIRALLALFRHPNPEARVRACLDIGPHTTPDVVTALVKATRDPVPAVRARAATGLVYSVRERKADAAIPRLREMLYDRDVEVRGCAVQALAETRDPKLVHTFLAILGERPLSNEEETPVLRALGMLPWNDPTVKTALSRRVPRLAESLRLGRAPVAVAGLLRSAGTPEARRVLEDAAMNHPREDVRGHAAYSLKIWDTGT